jgi:hypothetical protein
LEGLWLNDLAVGPLAPLQQQAIHLLGALPGKPAEDVLWQGFHRLALVAVKHPEEEALRRMLLQVAGRPNAPRAAQEAVSDLQPKSPR